MDYVIVSQGSQGSWWDHDEGGLGGEGWGSAIEHIYKYAIADNALNTENTDKTLCNSES